LEESFTPYVFLITSAKALAVLSVFPAIGRNLYTLCSSVYSCKGFWHSVCFSLNWKKHLYSAQFWLLL